LRRVAEPATQDWTRRGERGAVLLIRLIAWIALRLGRPVARLLLYPTCAYFLIFSAGSRRASRSYLARALNRKVTLRDQWRHYHTFAACGLDRVFLLNDRMDLFALDIHGENIATAIVEEGSGCLLLGAHLGSFEILRALGRRQPKLRVSLVMYEENARKVNSVLNAINPALTLDIIALGESRSMLEVEARLDAADFVGMLADRGLRNDGYRHLPFLGSPAPFPLGPFRLAVLLKRPVVLMLGLYRGANRYEIHFERLVEAGDFATGGAGCSVETLMRRYVARLEHYTRQAPYNWFNFYDFWT
jgi:predicted LPLAT superfamily acyltransferase